MAMAMTNLMAMTNNLSENNWDEFTKTSIKGSFTERLNADFFQFSAKILFWVAS